jgi:hypothetical protein
VHKSSRRRAGVKRAVAGGVLLLCLVASGLQPGPAGAGPADPVADEWELFSRINGRRQSAGLPPLAMQSGLRSIAGKWSGTMASRGSAGPNPNLGPEIEATVTPPPFGVAEHAASGASVAAIDQALWDNTTRRAVTLGQYEYVGIGVVWTGTTAWVTVDFLHVDRPLGSTTPPPVAWYLRNSNSAGPPDVILNYGDKGDRVVVCDWDGNGTDTVGVFRQGNFYLRNTNTTGIGEVNFAYGDPGDVALVGDWDNNDTDTVGVFRQGNFYLRNTNTTGIGEVNFAYGAVGDVALAGDWNDDGTDTAGVARNT